MRETSEKLYTDNAVERKFFRPERQDFLKLFVKPKRNFVRKIISFDRNASINNNELYRRKFTKKKTTFDRRTIRKMALLLPGHNEELIIATTIKSAIAAGQSIKDIYVVDDFSGDNTSSEAIKLLGRDNVRRVRRSGKALAVNKAIKHFNLGKRYHWLHVADADSVFGPDYFRIYKQNLNNKKHVVALGFVQSLRGNWISKYRSFTYTYSQHIFRRFQSYLGMISVFPGPITCFNTSILDKLEFDGNSLTEDFDITLQVHRKKLGKIKFIPEAVNYTQDPQSLRDFIKQNQRWQRGFFQGLIKYKIGTKFQAIDLGIMYQITELVFYTIQMFVILPIFLINTGNWQLLPLILMADYAILAVLALFSAILAKRWSIILSLPYFYILRLLEQAIFFQAFFEVVVLRKYRAKSTGWEVAGRRYKISSKALLDTAR